jgi:UDP-GlcNAc:undecaprenyl-phosphate/decaprenyl-phosphate GlcNAc-1-phosphate transferase
MILHSIGFYQIAALVGAFFLSLVITPICRKIALQIGLVDHPDKHRKLHREPIALCGGPTMLLCCFVAACSVPFFVEGIRGRFLADPWPLIGLMVGAVAIVLLGMLDDFYALRGRQKLMGQIAIACWMVWSGYRMDAIDLFNIEISSAYLVVPISIVWLLLTTNSLNLIDGADGLCSSVGWIASTGIAAMATLGGHTLEGSLAAGLAGAILGFLVYNFPPAKVYLGDAGSMLIGLMLGALALRTSLKGATAISLLGPVAIFAIPFFDSGMAILRRKLTGRSIFSTDRGHIHHSLLRWGVSHRGLLLLINLACAITAGGALVGYMFKSELIALLSTLMVLGCLVASRAFGYTELKLLTNRVYHFCESFVPQLESRNQVGGIRIQGRQNMIRLQGNRSWETIWNAFLEFADKHDLAKISLDLNVPWLHEGFHANWNRTRMPDDAHLWRVQLPVFADDRSLGRVSIVGHMATIDSVSILNELVEMLEGLQPAILVLADESAEADASLKTPFLSPAISDSSSNRPGTTTISL